MTIWRHPAPETGRAQPPWWLHAMLLVAVAGICMLWQMLALQFGYKRYVLSVELVLALGCLVWGWRWWGTVVLVLSLVLEMALGGAAVLKLFDWQQLTTMVGFASEANSHYQLWALGGMLLLWGLWCVLLVGVPKAGGRWFGWAVLLLATMQASLSFADGNFWRPVTATQDRLLLGSAALFVTEQLELNAQVHELQRHDNVEYVRIKSPSAVQTAWPDGLPSSPKVLVVVAESWGLPHDADVLAQQVAPLQAMVGEGRPLRQMDVGSVRAVGATALGEFRELCGKLPTKLNLKDITRERLGDCLPSLLKDKGYRTVGLHGASGGMYYRQYSYPAYGLDRLLFAEQLEGQLKARCHSFPGLCDRELASVAQKQFEDSSPVFVYWLTLNSHIPYDRRDLVREDDGLCGTLPTGATAQLCTYHQLHRQFFDNLAALLGSPALSGADVVVVGDHAPPFHDQASRARFVENKVPYLHILVR